MRKGSVGCVLAAWVLCTGSAVFAEDVYVRVPFSELEVTQGALPPRLADGSDWNRFSWTGSHFLRMSASIAGAGDAFLLGGQRDPSPGGAQAEPALFLRLEAPREVKGRLQFPNDQWTALDSLEFKVKPSPGDSAHKKGFLQAKEQHYESLASHGLPGSAWFRHQAGGARRELEKLGGDKTAENPELQLWRQARPGELEQTFDLFTGGRALSENLQLDRMLRRVEGGEPAVDVSTLKGITTAAIDWKPLVKELKPAHDPLASRIPADQHAVFFPSFQAMIDLLDEADKHGTPVLELLEARSEDSLTKERYERQLCLGISDLGRLLGPAVVSSVAFTGSDPYLRMGSDVAVLFETRAAEVLKGFVEAKQAAALKTNVAAKRVEGDSGGLRYNGVVSPDRSVSSYIAADGNVVIVTNSLAQLQRLAEASKEKAPSLAASDEYIFFRDRYKRGDKDESAFLLLTDATIRRWCGPAWRIADSRRTRAAAALSELAAEHLNEVASSAAKEGPIETSFSVPEAGSFRMTASGPASERYGTLGFMTPIVELSITRATQAEANAYNTFREGYQRNWRQFFDPIAIRFGVSRERLGVDVTVMPLIANTEYGQIIEFAKGGEIKASHGDPHPESLLHVALAVNPESGFVKQWGSIATTGMPAALKANPFGWLGGSISVYADASPRWDEVLQRIKESRMRELEVLPDLPVALRFEVKDGLGVTAFLTALRGLMEQSAPGQAVWETLSHNDVPYVRVSASKNLAADEDSLKKLAVYYAVGDGALVFTLNEDLLKRSIDRGVARRGAKKDSAGAAGNPWLGSSLALKAERKALDVISGLALENYSSATQDKSWANLPILNEWRRLFPGEDPVKVEERLWGVRLVCPAGGKYVWNEAWRTMESTACGHPGEPKTVNTLPSLLSELKGASFGITFEKDGLRARGSVERKGSEK